MEQKILKEHHVYKLFINFLLKKGKKNIAENKLKQILIKIKKKTKQKPFFILIKAIKHLMPKLKIITLITKKRYKSLNFLFFLTKKKQIQESISWLITNQKINVYSIVNNIIQTSKKKGLIFNKKKELYKKIKKSRFNIKT